MEWDRKVFRRHASVQIKDETNLNLDTTSHPTTSSEEAAKKQGEEADDNYNEWFKIWRNAFEYDRHTRLGWLQTNKVRSNFNAMRAELRKKSDQQRLLALGTVDLSRNKAALEFGWNQWQDVSAALTPMLTASIDGEVKSYTYIQCRGNGSEDAAVNHNVLSDLIKTQNAGHVVKDDKIKLPEFLPDFILAEIFQEVDLIPYYSKIMNGSTISLPKHVDKKQRVVAK